MLSNGWDMSQPLPVSDFKWMKEKDLDNWECVQMGSTTRPFVQWNLILARLPHSKTFEKHENKDKLFELNV